LWRWTCVLAVAFAIAGASASTAAARVQVVGLQVALRAEGLYLGPIDGIYGPRSARALRRFQRRAGLDVDGRVGPATRHALGPLGRPSFGSRTESREAIGWDVSVTQFLLREKGAALPINGYFDSRTERTVRAFQRSQGLAVDGIAGPVTLAALVDRTDRRKVRTSNGAIERVRSLLDYWARYYAVDRALVRALAWMESGYQANLTSSAGAWGVMQVLPSTWVYVETVLLGQRIPRTVSGDIRVGVAFLRELLREFNGDQRVALAAWYQGPTSFRRHGPLRTTRHFVANVVALKQRTV
jgi:putative peptidoglycan binding protein/transglycosylase-like protein with SLT domain